MSYTILFYVLTGDQPERFLVTTLRYVPRKDDQILIPEPLQKRHLLPRIMTVKSVLYDLAADNFQVLLF